MVISLIAAMAENRVIGYRNRIPWNIPSDQRRFREITMGHTVLFGRVTFESIGHPLPGRKNIVLVHSLEEAFAECAGEEEIFICGGGIVFEETIGHADRVYLTVVHHSYPGDTFFPILPEDFSAVAREEVNDTPPYSFIRFERKKRQGGV
jgi:dihydrofolate reductase